jgi:hypothetical protein
MHKYRLPQHVHGAFHLQLEGARSCAPALRISRARRWPNERAAARRGVRAGSRRPPGDALGARNLLRAGAILAAFLLCVTSASATSAQYWSLDRVHRQLDRTVIVVGSQRVRVHSATTLCAGAGRPIRRSGIRMWRRFTCRYTTFTKAGLGPDLDLLVYVRSATRFSVARANWVEGIR